MNILKRLRGFFLFSACLLPSLLAAGEPLSPSLNLGPFAPSPAFALYWMNRPAGCGASLLLKSTSDENALIRVYNRSSSSESLIFHSYISVAKGAVLTLPLALTDPPPPVTEIRLSIGGTGLSVALAPTCLVRDYGVSFQNGAFTGWANAPAPLYAYIPWRAETLTLVNESPSPLAVAGVTSDGHQSDATGPVGGRAAINGAGTASLVPRYVSWPGNGSSDVIWRFDFQPNPTQPWKFKAAGFPLMLCSSEHAAALLKAGEIFDGQHRFSHPAQYHIMHSLIPDLSAQLGSSQQLSGLFTAFFQESRLNVFPNFFLLGKWGPFNDLWSALAWQNVVPGSDWIGSSGGWQHRDPASPEAGGQFIPPSSESVTWVAGGRDVHAPLLDPSRWDRSATAKGTVLPSGIAAPEMAMGVSLEDGTTTEGLAVAALLDGSQSTTPFINPFYGSKALLYRAAIAALRDLAALPSSEVWNTSNTELSTYPGGQLAFFSARKVFPNYGKIGFFMRRLFCASAPGKEEITLYNCAQINALAPMTDKERNIWNFSAREIALWKNVFADWTEMLHRFAYRMYPNNLVSARNQSSHYLLSFQLLADGSGDPFDQDLAKKYAERWIAGQDAAGWFSEASGPDASYIGMTNYHVAAYYLDTCQMKHCDEAIAASLIKAYRFFDYTVAPEPAQAGTSARKITAGFPFNHRVGSGFNNQQWGGAGGIANAIPEVVAWTPDLKSSPPMMSPPSAHMPSAFSLPSNPAANTDMLSSRYFGSVMFAPAKPASWPAESAQDFTTDVGDAHELIAVKRAGYYTSLYVAHPANDKQYISSANYPNQRLAWQADGESSGCRIGDTHNWNTPFVGGGVTLFWTPDFGSGILAGSWTPLAHHGLVLTDGQSGVRTWEDYFTASFVRPSENQLAVIGTIESMQSKLPPVVSTGSNATSPCTGILPSGAPPQSNIHGLSYSRSYHFGENAMVVTTEVSASSSASAPYQSTMEENIPVPGGPIKSATGVTQFYFPGAAAPIANETVVQAHEIDIKGSASPAGIRIVFNGLQPVTVTSNGPAASDGSLQFNRLQIALPIPERNHSVQLQYCIESLKAAIAECGF